MYWDVEYFTVRTDIGRGKIYYILYVERLIFKITSRGGHVGTPAKF